MSPSLTLPDADGEIAAVVCGAGQRAEFMLALVSHEARARGLRVVGSIQSRAGAGPGPLALARLGEDETVALPSPRVAGGDCAALARLLAGETQRLVARVRAGVDLVVVGRFGRLEARGEGYWPLMVAAHATCTPLLVGVPAAAAEAWRERSRGMCVHLPPRLDAIRKWLGGVFDAPPRPPGRLFTH